MGGEGTVNETVFSVLCRCSPLIEFLRKKIKKKCLEGVICCAGQIVLSYTQNPAKRACSFVIPGKTFIPLWCNFGTVKFPNSAFVVIVSLHPHCCWSQFLTQSQLTRGCVIQIYQIPMLLSTLLGPNSNSALGKTLLFKTSCFDCHEKAWTQHQRQQQQLCLLGLQLSLSSCTVASLYHLVWMKKDHMSMLQQWPVHLFGRNIILIKNYKTETAS